MRISDWSSDVCSSDLNVSTNEVSEAISVFPGIKEANVFGVSIPGTDGRAGMAAIVCDPGLDLVKLHAHIVKELPDYARPLFIRLSHEMEVTGTFKHQIGRAHVCTPVTNAHTVCRL